MCYLKNTLTLLAISILFSCASMHPTQIIVDTSYNEALTTIKNFYNREHLLTLQRRPDPTPPKITEHDFGDRHIIEIQTYRPKLVIDYKTTIEVSQEGDVKTNISVISTEFGLFRMRATRYEQERMGEIIKALKNSIESNCF